jgi:hypothetical protein
MQRWRGRIVAIVVASILSSCGGIRVRPVDYRLPGLVAGPVDRGSVKDGRQHFAPVFCGTLNHLKNDAHETWKDCTDYIEVKTPVTPVDMPLKSVRVLVVAGVFSECLEDSGVKAFLDAKKHFDQYHRAVNVEHVRVSALGTSSNNAGEIREYVKNHPGDGFVAVGYSKGAGDWMEAIAAYEDVKTQVLALVTIAGSVGGSRLPDLFGKDFIDRAQGAIRDIGLKNCQVADGGGLTSLSRSDRQAFLQKYPVGVVPAYSVAAVATDRGPNGPQDRTISRVLRAPWDRLRVYSLDQDSQVIADDAVVPGGTLLAIARADHWAIALPFEETTDPKQRRRALENVDRNTYPRTALLEAILRMAVR